MEWDLGFHDVLFKDLLLLEQFLEEGVLELGLHVLRDLQADLLGKWQLFSGSEGWSVWLRGIFCRAVCGWSGLLWGRLL